MTRSNTRRWKHENDMAVINAAILNAQKPATPGAAPAIANDPRASLNIPDISEGQARFLKEQRGFLSLESEEKRKVRIEQERRQRDIYEAQVKIIGKEEADRKQAEAEEAARKSRQWANVKAIARETKDAVHGADVRLGRIPTPGSVAFPLLVLLIAFFFLIQVNGYTRAGWLWLVLIGQAKAQGTIKTGSEPFQAKGGGPPVEQAPITYTPIISSPNGVLHQPY